ncbi:MAG: L-asparaginase [Burkholderiales bacterium RIFCSPLOWO2_12_FULL_61_40]|nr:MAG: L-asparaginase [Burkholderiales bacterium RIFCSPLOWO2_12_FULL_61_40]
MAKKLVFLGMGGTIAGTAASAADNVGYRAAQVGVDQLLQAIPTLEMALGRHELVSEQVAQVDSKDMVFTHWNALALRVCHYLAQPDVSGLVITHGTDTIEETAFFLSQVVPTALLESKPVVMACAMRPASSLSPDGPRNVLDAVALACTEGATGVMVVCAGTIHSAQHVQKVYPYRLDAFDSGDAGPMGYVEEGVVRLTYSWPKTEVIRPSISHEKLAQAVWPRVEIVTSYVGASGAMVRALCSAPQGSEGPLCGLVVAGTGNGTIHTDLDAALREARALGIQVVRSTRCAWGQIIPPSVLGDGFPHFKGLSPVKARIALILDLLA